MSGKIIGPKGILPPTEVQKKQEQTVEKKPGSKEVRDKIEFSSALQEMKRVRGEDAAAGSERAEKIEALKTQIQEGNYRPDLQKVAASLLRFLAGERKS